MSGRGPSWEEADEAVGRGVGEGVRSEERSDAAPHPLMYEWMALITSLHTLRGMKLLQMGLWGIGGREGGRRHRLSEGDETGPCEKHENLNTPRRPLDVD